MTSDSDMLSFIIIMRLEIILTALYIVIKICFICEKPRMCDDSPPVQFIPWFLDTMLFSLHKTCTQKRERRVVLQQEIADFYDTVLNVGVRDVGYL